MSQLLCTSAGQTSHYRTQLPTPPIFWKLVTEAITSFAHHWIDNRSNLASLFQVICFSVCNQRNGPWSCYNIGFAAILDAVGTAWVGQTDLQRRANRQITTGPRNQVHSTDSCLSLTVSKPRNLIQHRGPIHIHTQWKISVFQSIIHCQFS